MNTSTTTSAPPAPQRSDAAQRPNNAGDRQRSEDFERALRQKAGAHDDDGGSADESTTPPPDGCAVGFLTWAAPPPIKQFGGESDGAAGQLDAAAATGKALQAALAGETAPTPALAPATDAAGAWEVTLRQPLGAALDVRATRSADVVNGWSLSIGSPTLDASVLSRHAPKLNERLKARALSNTHARIQESDPESPQ